MTKPCIHVLCLAAGLLLFIGGPSAATAQQKEVGVTGTTTVPGQDGNIEYDIRAKETGKQDQFKITVHLRPKKEPTSSFSDKKFYVCMMFQLTKKPEKDCPERVRTTKRDTQKRVSLTTTTCMIADP